MTPYQAKYEVPVVLNDGYGPKVLEGPFQLEPNPDILFDPAYNPSHNVHIKPSCYSWHTLVRSRAKTSNKKTSESLIEELKIFIEKTFRETFVLEETALISGYPILLRTNSAHLLNFWSRNWYLGNHVEVTNRFGGFPITLNAAVGVCDSSGKPFPTGAYFCPRTRDIVFINTDYYGQCKSWALGAAGIGLKDFGIHSIHGACVEIDQQGVLIIAPTGTGKSTYTNQLAEYGFINSDDWVYVKEEGGRFFAYPSERHIYVRSNVVRDNPENGGSPERVQKNPVMKKQFEIFERSPAENVPLENKKRVYDAVPNSRVMIDPREISPMSYKSPLSVCFLLRRNPVSPYIQRLTPEEAVSILVEGEYTISPGTTDDRDLWGTLANEPWYNPYLLAPDHNFETDRFLAMFRSGVVPYAVNTHARYAGKRDCGKPDLEDLIRFTTDKLLSLVREASEEKYLNS